MGRRKIRRGPSQREIRQGFSTGRRNPLHPALRRRIRRAPRHRGPLALFSTDTGDAWLLDPADHFAARLARDGDPEPIHFEETDTNFAIGWKGNYSVDGDAFVFIDNDSARIVTILGYPTGRIAQLGKSENFKYVWLALSTRNCKEMQRGLE